MKKLFTVSEVAEYLGVSESTVYNLVRKGEIVGTYIGSSIRVKENDLEDFISKPHANDDIVIVTRHKGAVEWLERRGITGQTFDRVKRSDIRDKVVYGVIPLPMSRFAKEVHVIDMPYADQNYEEMTADDMEQAGASLVTLVVTVKHDRGSVR